jgi:hypothetical protein
VRKVTVDKEQLREMLQKNRETHQADFEIAWKAFRKRAEEDLQEKLRALKAAGRPQQVNLWIGLEVPEDHTEDYDRAISMLDWEVRDEVTLEENEFKQLIQDKWNWSAKFHSDNVFYTASESPSTTIQDES